MITDTTIAGLQLQDPNVCPLDIVESHPTVVAGGTTAVDTVKFEDLGQENPVLENFFGPVHPVFGSDQSNVFKSFYKFEFDFHKLYYFCKKGHRKKVLKNVQKIIS